MPEPTYTALATVTLGSSASSVTFSSIPATYRDLVVVISPTTSVDGTEVLMRVNGDTGSNYAFVYALGTGSTTFSAAGTAASFGLLLGRTSRVTNVLVNLMDYSATDKHKTILQRDNDSGWTTVMRAGRWANTAAINTIVVSTSSGTFNSGSTFNLYGIAS